MITLFLLRERYKVSIITSTRCPSSYMYCIDMLRRALMVEIKLLNHVMWSRNTIFMSLMIVSTKPCLFNISLVDLRFIQKEWGVIYRTLDLVRWVCGLVQIGMLLLLVESPSQRDWNSTHLNLFWNKGMERMNTMAQVHVWNEHFGGTKWVIVHLDWSAQ